MRCAFHPHYQAPLSAGFPVSKHRLLADRLLEEGILSPQDLVRPEPLDLATARLVHRAEYLDKLEAGRLSPEEERRLGLRWSPTLWRRSRLASAGTLWAAREALEQGLAGNLAGGAHHAFADHGEGFCILNDVAIAIFKLRAEGTISRAAVVDLDVHQGNGTAAICAGVPQIFTFSIHAERNYPTVKARSTLDLGLPDGAGDEDYLDLVLSRLPEALDRSAADIVFYLAGVDVAAGDRFGKLSLSEEGIRRRERLVVDAVRRRSMPLVILLAGGYAPTPARTAELHAHAFREAAAHERGR